MSASRYQGDPVTGGFNGTDDQGAVVERLQPNRATGGLDVYRGGRLETCLRVSLYKLRSRDAPASASRIFLPSSV